MNYPQCEKLNEVLDQAMAIRNFLKFIQEQGHDVDLGYTDQEDLILDFFEIDAGELERERQHMLENL